MNMHLSAASTYAVQEINAIFSPPQVYKKVLQPVLP